MTQFATSDDLSARLGVTLASDEQARANTLLEKASGLIQREARQQIELVDADVFTTVGRPDRRLRLPERPVVSVASVSLDGNALTEGTDWFLAGDSLVRKWSAPSCWPDWGREDQQPVVVTYSHGFDEIPDAIQIICVEAVVRVWVNPGNAMHEFFGSERTVFAMQATPTGMLLNADERRVIWDTFRRTAGSVALR